MLQITNLTITHQKDLMTLIENFSCTINAGEKIGIIAEEGNGKSALLKWIAGEKEIESYLIISGELINQFDSIGYLPQFLPTKYENESIYYYLTQELDLSEIDYRQFHYLLLQMQLDQELPFSSQLMSSLSGGEKIKIQLLCLLMKNPDLLLLDEPTNDLDIDTMEWLEKFIRDTNLTVVFVSHDVTLLNAVTTGVIHIERLIHKSKPKTAFARLNYQEYLLQRQQQFSKSMQIARKQRLEDKKRMQELNKIKSSVRHQLINTKNDVQGRLLAKKMRNVQSQEKRFEKERNQFEAIPIQEDAIGIYFSEVIPIPNGKEIFSLSNECLRQNERMLVSSIDFRMVANQKIGIVGRNGIGKTTLIKKILPLMKQRQDLSVGYMPQNYEEALNLSCSAIDFILEDPEAFEKTRLMTYLGSLNFLVEEMQRPMNELSGGQKAKILLAKFDFNKNNVLILDEPTRNLSPSSFSELVSIFQNYPGTILMISHDREFLKSICETIYELTPKGLVERTIK